MNEIITDSVLYREIIDSGLPFDVEILRNWMEKFNHKLPEEIIEFLMGKNGGSYYSSACIPMIDKSEFDELGALSLFGFNMPEVCDYYGLEDQNHMHDERIPCDCVAIGSSGDDLLMVDNANNGQIRLWIRDYEGSWDNEKNRLLVAESYADMLKSAFIEPVEERRNMCIVEEEEPFISIEAHDLEGLIKHLSNSSPTPEELCEYLCKACDNRFSRAVSHLIGIGVDPDCQCSADRPPIQFAYRDGAIEIILYLLQKGADLNRFLKAKKLDEVTQCFIEEWKSGKRQPQYDVF